MISLNQVLEVRPHEEQGVRGYQIVFTDSRVIFLTKRRTIIALLVLIHKGQGTEADLAKGNDTILEIRQILGERLPQKLVRDFYGDANKPFSELWNEEGFTFIDNLKGGRSGSSQVYSLKKDDHEKLFGVIKKAFRRAPTKEQQELIRRNQNGRCNCCGANIFPKNRIEKSMYAKDRRREVFDHRFPVEKGGDSTLENFQALCFYCNKAKWQICNICDLPDCDSNCALRSPEESAVIAPTGEDISDLLMSKKNRSE